MKSSAVLFLTLSFLLALTGCSQKSKNAEASKKSSNITSNIETPPPTATPKPAKVAAPKAEKTPVKGQDTVTCTSGEDIRIVQVKNVGKGCELLYTKNGQENKVASANHETEYCQTRSDKLAKTLQDSGFDCK